MQLARILCHSNRIDKADKDMSNLKNFRKQFYIQEQVDDDIDVAAHFISQGFEVAEGWDADNVLYSKRLDCLVEIDYDEVDTDVVSAQELLQQVKQGVKSS